MPDEEGAIERGEEPKNKQFDGFVVRGSGSSKKSSPHEIGITTYGKVYANDLASLQIESKNAIFPVGSVLVREKYLSETDKIPEVVTVMVKREKGFSRQTGDWEFLTFNGSDLKLQKRETKSDCSKCHSQTKETDWVFKTYLK